MIVETPTREIISYGVKNKAECRIRANAKAFRVLYKNLYSDPIRAIIRELSTNARDSHVLAGKADVPFEVHLPTWTSNLFKVRDFGVGMSREKIETLYADFFASDKEDSNEMTGFLGIGSKSPLSYTRQFNIVSYQGGKKHLFTLCINENDVPELNDFGTVDTDEPDGLEVSFCVKKEDYEEFKRKAVQVFQFFRVKPKFTGAQIEVPTVNFTHVHPTWSYYGTGYGSEYRGPVLIMGDIAYPVAPANVDPFKYSHLCYANIVFKAEIGDVHMNASREGLEYDDVTKKSLERLFEGLHNDLVSEIQAQIDNTTGVFDTFCLYNELQDKEPYSNFKDILNQKVKFSRPISTKFYPSDVIANKYPNATNQDAYFQQYTYGRKDRFPSGHYKYTKKLFLIINDVGERKGRAKVRYHSHINSDKTFILVWNKDNDYKEFLTLFDNPAHVLKVSELADPPKVETEGGTYVRRERGKVNCYKFTFDPVKGYWSEWGFKSDAEVVRLDLEDEPDIYVEINRGKFVGITEGYIKGAAGALDSPLTFYGIKSADLGKLDGKDDWIHISKYLKEQVAAKIKGSNVGNVIAEVQSLSLLPNTWFWDNPKLKLTDKNYNNILENIKRVRELKTDKFQKLIWAAKVIGYSLTGNASFNFVKASEDFFNKYPFLSVIDNYSWRNMSKSVQKNLEKMMNAVDNAQS
jgi:hypothetical protein